MNREEALSLVKEKIKNNNLIKHCLAVEVCMRALAECFKEDKEKWGLAGLLHDIDYEQTVNDPQQHSLIGAEMLKEAGLDNDIVEAVKTHNEMHGITPESRMAKALYVVDPLTGLVIATALVLPNKKINEVTTENVLNRFKEKSFARGANRKIIAKSGDLLGLSLEELAGICLKAMQSIANDLGL